MLCCYEFRCSLLSLQCYLCDGEIARGYHCNLSADLQRLGTASTKVPAWQCRPAHLQPCLGKARRGDEHSCAPGSAGSPFTPRFHKAVPRRCVGHPEAADAQGLCILRAWKMHLAVHFCTSHRIANATHCHYFVTCWLLDTFGASSASSPSLPAWLGEVSLDFQAPSGCTFATLVALKELASGSQAIARSGSAMAPQQSE